MHNTAVGLGSIRCRRPGGSCESVSVQHGNGLLRLFDVCGKSGRRPRRGHSLNGIPRFYHKRSKYKLILFPSNCLSDLRSFFFLYHSVCRFVLKQNSENNECNTPGKSRFYDYKSWMQGLRLHRHVNVMRTP